MKEKVLVTHWRGPFSDAQIDNMKESSVLYLATGRVADERRSKIQYCGITNQSICHRVRRHPKVRLIALDLQIWIG